jgi:PAS domain S-box-containing protein
MVSFPIRGGTNVRRRQIAAVPLVPGLAAVVRALGGSASRRAKAKAEGDWFFELSPDLMAVAGLDGRWKRVNPAFQTCLGYTESEMVGRSFMDLVHPDDREQTEPQVRRVTEGEPILGFENRHACKDGSYRWFEWWAAPVLTEGLIYGVARDVTERKEAESELAASRMRIVAAADEVRRRIERNLHDGTQQRLVTLVLAMRTAEADVPAGLSGLQAELSRIATGLGDAISELREISRGIHPAVLSEAGLGPALRTLASRSAVPVLLDVEADTRFPEPIEVAAYFVASEALANAAKHAQASHMEMSFATRGASLMLSIRDDGAGGADPEKGSGLLGLQDRVEAVGGTIAIDSPPGGGTSLLATLPLDVEPAE